MTHFPEVQSRRLPKSDADERRYHLAMADFCTERGFRELARSHLIQAEDCPAGCGCATCRTTRHARRVVAA